MSAPPYVGEVGRVRQLRVPPRAPLAVCWGFDLKVSDEGWCQDSFVSESVNAFADNICFCPMHHVEVLSARLPPSTRLVDEVRNKLSCPRSNVNSLLISLFDFLVTSHVVALRRQAQEAPPVTTGGRSVPKLMTHILLTQLQRRKSTARSKSQRATRPSTTMKLQPLWRRMSPISSLRSPPPTPLQRE